MFDVHVFFVFFFVGGAFHDILIPDSPKLNGSFDETLGQQPPAVPSCLTCVTVSPGIPFSRFNESSMSWVLGCVIPVIRFIDG